MSEKGLNSTGCSSKNVQSFAHDKLESLAQKIKFVWHQYVPPTL